MFPSTNLFSKNALISPLLIVNRVECVSSENSNLLIGTNTNGLELTSGSSNVLLGCPTGTLLTTGSANTLVGGSVGMKLSTGTRNTCLGHETCGELNSGDDNVVVGASAGAGLTQGSTNVLMGPTSGSLLVTGSGNTCCGANSNVSHSAAVNQTALGNGAVCVSDNSIMLGDANVRGVHVGSLNALPGPFANNSKAAEAGVKVGQLYRLSGSGHTTICVRI